VTNFSPDSASIYNVGGGASDSREHLIGQKIWWEAEVQRVMSSNHWSILVLNANIFYIWMLSLFWNTLVY